MKEKDEKILNEELVSFTIENNNLGNNNCYDEECSELDYEEGEYEFDSWEEMDFKIELEKLKEGCTLSFHFCDYHREDKWCIFEFVYISLKNEQVVLKFDGHIHIAAWDGPENIQHLFKYLSETIIESGIFIHSEDDDLELDKWCTITLGVLIDKDFMFFETANHYMKLIKDLETKAKQKWFENIVTN